ncbi:lysophospholipase [Cellulomonas chitinilytica]|uniref:Lysophospholipase n=1 Tax=Cellulomonas chitinilytica TaxID=398759 RepID=A0A919TXI7_9CELL|nr:alpha/beta hydrolase [Cellulomonas chitinilytica]GIG19475.1 lysophospholipase [Cellulomonas chitinilytica]
MWPPVVLVHGLRASRTMWRAQVESVERAGGVAVAVDLPGHGRRLEERFTLEESVATVSRAVDGLGGRALVVGLSLGGYVGIAHAARRPDQVVGLVAAGCSTQPRRLVLSGWDLAGRVIARLPDAGAGLNRFMVARTVPPAAVRDLEEGGYALGVTGDVMREMAQAAPVADLARIEAPVWLVNGRFDHFRGEERVFLRATRNGRLVVVPHATHLVNLVQPTRFSRVLLEVLDELGAAGGATAPEPDVATA